jgi:large repetitive protein
MLTSMGRVRPSWARAGLCAVLAAGLLLVGSLESASAQTQTLSIFVDRDGSPTSGCSVTIDGQTMVGVDVRIDTTINVGSSPSIGAITRSSCSGGAFGAASAFGASGAFGIGNGVDGSDVIELGMAESALLDSTARRTGFGFALTGSAGSDVLFGSGSGFSVFGPSQAIPGPGVWMLLGVAVVMLIVGLIALRRTRRLIALSLLAMAGVAAAAPFVVDGQVGDWLGIAPLATAAGSGSGVDIHAVYLARDAGNAYVRVDASGLRFAAPSFTSGNSGSLTVGSAGSLAITAAGLPTPTIALTAGSLPSGISFDAATATLSGTPTAGSGGSYALTFTASNTQGSVEQAYTLAVHERPSITSADVTTFQLGQAGSFTVTADGFPAASSFAVSGALPSGIAFDTTSGTLSGTPGAGTAGDHALVFSASNAAGSSDPQSFTLTIVDGPVFTSADAVTFTVGEASSFTVSASGTPAPTLSLSGGPLPASLSFDATTGVLSGTPDAGTGGSHALEFTASNSQGSTVQAFTLTVHEAPSITSAASTTFTVGTAASFTVTADGFPAASFVRSGDPLPPGLSFNTESGLLSGIPLSGSGGTHSFGFIASNAAGSSAEQAFTLTIDEAPAFTSADATTFTVGTAGSFTVAASGTPAPTLSLTAGTLPDGVSFNAGTGELSGTPDAGTGGSHALTFTASNSVGDVTQAYVLTVHESPSITSVDNTTFLIGNAGSFTVTADGFPASTFAIGGALPAGVSFDPASGVLSGTPDAGAGGTYALTFTATNAAGSSAAQAFTLTVQQGPAFTSTDATTFTVGSAGSFTVAASGTPAPSLSLTAGTLPDGVSFNAGTGELSGTPDAGTGGTHALTFTASNSVGNVTQAFVLTVHEAPSITSVDNTTFLIGTAGSFTVTADGFPASTFAIGGVALPAGVSFDPASGVLSGTPDAGTGGTYALTFTATNAAGSSAAQAFTLTVQQGPAFTSADATTFTVGSAGSFTVAASGTPAPALSHTGGTLPGGISFTPATGALAGTPDVGTGGSYVLEFTATNTVDAVTQSFTLTVNQAPAITSANTTTFTVGSAGSFTVTSSGHPDPAIGSSGTLPGGVSFTDNGDGTATLAGTPAAGTHAASPYDLVFTAANGIGSDATQNFSLLIECAAIALSPAAGALSASYNVAYSQAFTPSGGTAPYTIAQTAGTLPPGLSLDGATGVLSGTPTDAGVYAFTLQATDGVSCQSASQAYTLTVSLSAGDDSYNALGNVLVDSSTGTPFSVVANDSFPSGTTISAFDPATPGGGTVTMSVAANAALGRFTYNPPRGKAAGTEAFTYTLSRQGAGATAAVTATATVTFTHSGRVWFIDSACVSSCDGRLSNPYASTGAFQAANAGADPNDPAANDPIFVVHRASAYNGALVLRNGQRLIGSGAAGALATLAGVTAHPGQSLPATAGSRPVLTNTGATVITLGSGNRLHGVELGNSTTALSGSTFGTLVVSDNVAIATTGTALSLSGGTLEGGFARLHSSGGTRNVYLDNVATTGTVGLGDAADTLSGASSNALEVAGGAGSFAYPGNITNTTALAVRIVNKTGGTVTLSGSINPAAAARGIEASGNSGGSTIVFSGSQKRISSGTGLGVALVNNTGATINFTNGGLSIASTTGTGFTAIGGAAGITVQGTGNVITTTGGTALNVVDSAIGSAGLTFERIGSSGGAATGIILNGTGALGGLTVTGAGTAGSGGTIANKTGADGSTVNGIGIYLNNTRSVVLSRMQLNDFSNYAIRGLGVVGFELRDSVISGSNGSSDALDEGSVSFDNLTGSALIANSSISGGFEDNFRLLNTSGTLNRIVFDAVTFGANHAGFGNDSVFIGGYGNSVVNVTVQDSTFTAARGDLFQMSVPSSAGADLVFTDNLLSNNHPDIATGGGGVSIGSEGSGAFTFDVSNNSFRDSIGHAKLYVKSLGTGSMTGIIANNAIGVSAVANSGSLEGDGIKVHHAGGGPLTVGVIGNDVRQYNNMGIQAQAGAGLVQSGNFDIAVTGNTVADPGNNPSVGGIYQGVHLNNGVTPGDAFQTCIDVENNSAVGSGRNGGVDKRLRQRQSTTVRLPGYLGAPGDTGAVHSYLVARNVGAPSGLHAGAFGGGGACIQP